MFCRFIELAFFFQKKIRGCLFFRLELFTDFFSPVKFICHHFLFLQYHFIFFPQKLPSRQTDFDTKFQQFWDKFTQKVTYLNLIKDFLQTFYLALRSHQLTTNVNRILKSHDFDGDIVLFSLHIWQALSGATTLLPNLDKFFRKLISNSKPSLVNIYFALRISQF